MDTQNKVITTNRQAYHNYFIEDTYECGIELVGTEVKSIRLNHVNLKDSFAYIKEGEVFVANMHISPYEKGNIFNKDPMRVRKLLLNRREIRKIKEKVQQDGYTLVPVDLHFSKSLVKLSLAVAKGKKLYDKRDTEAKKTADRKINQALRIKNR